MIDGATNELLQTIEEQAEFIMRQADRINRLSALLLQHCEVDKAELESLVREEDKKNEISGRI